MKKIIKAAAALSAALIICAVIFNESRSESGNRLFFAMDTVIDISAEAENIDEKLEALEKLINELDSELSRTKEDSLIYRLNHSVRSSAELDADALSLLKEAAELRDFTEGAFDISIAPVMDLWGFTSGKYRVPDEKEIAEALKKAGMEHIHINKDIVTLDAGSELDLGGIAKGYALEKTRDFFRENHVKRGISYMGGDILAYGSKAGGKPWIIGIEDPGKTQSGEPAAALRLKNSYIMSSGNYQRFFIENGIRYHHILDPLTGCPAESGLSSVTITADAGRSSGAMCDALATALFVMGKDRAVDFWRSNPGLFEFVLITDRNEILVSSGLEKALIPGESGKYEYIIVR